MTSVEVCRDVLLETVLLYYRPHNISQEIADRKLEAAVLAFGLAVLTRAEGGCAACQAARSGGVNGCGPHRAFWLELEALGQPVDTQGKEAGMGSPRDRRTEN